MSSVKCIAQVVEDAACRDLQTSVSSLVWGSSSALATCRDCASGEGSGRAGGATWGLPPVTDPHFGIKFGQGMPASTHRKRKALRNGSHRHITQRECPGNCDRGVGDRKRAPKSLPRELRSRQEQSHQESAAWELRPGCAARGLLRARAGRCSPLWAELLVLEAATRGPDSQLSEGRG